MLRKPITGTLLACAIVLIGVAPARAQQQTFNFTIGAFAPFGEDARAVDDVLVANRTFLFFDIDEFKGPTVGAEWLVPVGDFFEVGAGASFSRRTVPSVYLDFVDDQGFEIEQETRLRLAPIAFTARVVPLGQSRPVQPYVGAGLALVNYRYSEFGDFIDFGAGLEVFRDTFTATGTQPGGLILGGLRFAGESASAGFEVRYQKAQADLDDQFAAPVLDLGGWTYNFTVGARF
jgi:hypothetical protein